MWESFFGFKKTPFGDRPDAKQLFASQAWNQVKARLEFLAQHHGVGLITGEVGAGKSTAARVFTTTLNTSLYKILYVHTTSCPSSWSCTTVNRESSRSNKSGPWVRRFRFRGSRLQFPCDGIAHKPRR
jgi:type II secretory pathway predicted ATPase ExeA